VGIRIVGGASVSRAGGCTGVTTGAGAAVVSVTCARAEPAAMTVNDRAKSAARAGESRHRTHPTRPRVTPVLRFPTACFIGVLRAAGSSRRQGKYGHEPLPLRSTLLFRSASSLASARRKLSARCASGGQHAETWRKTSRLTSPGPVHFTAAESAGFAPDPGDRFPVNRTIRLAFADRARSPGQPQHGEECMRNADTVAEDKQPRAENNYREPRLVVYGDVREITGNVGPKGNLDGGGGAAAGPKTGL
jgi:hypothetical protein